MVYNCDNLPERIERSYQHSRKQGAPITSAYYIPSQPGGTRTLFLGSTDRCPYHLGRKAEFVDSPHIHTGFRNFRFMGFQMRIPLPETLRKCFPTELNGILGFFRPTCTPSYTREAMENYPIPQPTTFFHLSGASIETYFPECTYPFHSYQYSFLSNPP